MVMDAEGLDDEANADRATFEKVHLGKMRF